MFRTQSPLTRVVAGTTIVGSALGLTGCAAPKESRVTEKPTPGPVPTRTAESTESQPVLNKFRDDFKGTKLDPDHWAVADYPGTNNNGYRKPGNVQVKDGKLVLSGKGTDVAGMCFCGTKTPDYSYGDYTFRVRSDVGGGYVPAVILWPMEDKWPEGGEIDAIEMTDADRKTGHVTFHFPDGDVDASTSTTTHVDFSKWVDVKVEWRPDRITVLFDGNKAFETTVPGELTAYPKHPVIQLDAYAHDDNGYEWGDPLTKDTPQPFKYEVDYVEFSPIVGISVVAGQKDPITSLGPDFGF